MRKTLMNGAAAAALGISFAVSPMAFAADNAEVKTDAEVTASNSINVEELMGEDVYSIDGEDIGDIESLMVGSDGKIRYVIVSFGGFLGMGEKEVALPWERFTVGPDGEEVSIDVTEAEIEQMPDFEWPEDYETGTVLQNDEYGRTDDLGTQMADEAEEMGSDVAEGAEETAEDVVDGTEKLASDVAEGAEDAAQEAEQAAENAADAVEDAVDEDEIAASAETGMKASTVHQLAASNLIGTDIITGDDEDVGEVNDLVLNGEGRIEGVLVDVGGFLGIDEKQVLLSWNELELMRDENEDLSIRVGLNQSAIESMPEYEPVTE